MSTASEFEFDPCYLSQGRDHSVSLPFRLLFVLILLQELWRAASVTAPSILCRQRGRLPFSIPLLFHPPYFPPIQLMVGVSIYKACS